jgi:WD40 repeat protein/cell division protein FtsB
MDYATLSAALSRRDSLGADARSWSASTSITASLLVSLAEEVSLLSAVEPLRAATARLEDELASNSECAQRLRDLQALELRVRDLEAIAGADASVIAGLTAEVGALDAQAAPLRAELEALTARESDFRSAVARLESHHSAKQAGFVRGREMLEDLVRKDHALRAREDEMIQRLLRLREREAVLRSAELMPAAPAVDVSAMTCPTPRGAGEAAAYDAMLDGLGAAAEQIERLKAGNAVKRHGDSVTCLAFSPTQPLLASGGEDTVVAIMRTDTHQSVGQLADAKGSVMAVDFSPTDQLLLSASWDHAVRVYRIAGSNLVLAYNCKDHTDCVYDARFLSNDRFVSCSRDQTVRLFDIKSMTPVSTFTSSSRPFSVCALQGGSLVATAHFDGKIRGWDFRARGPPLEFKPHKGTIGFVTTLPGGTQIVSYGSDDKLIVVSDLRAKNLIGKVPHRPAVSREKIQLGIWGEHAVVGGQNGQLCSYDLTSFKLKETLKGSDAPVYCVTSKMNFGIATGDQAGVIKFWFN